MQRFKKYISLKKYRDWLPYKKQIQKNIFFCSYYKNAKTNIKWIESNCKNGRIKGYKSMSEERLVSSINESEWLKESEENFDGARIEKIKKDFSKLRDKRD